MTSDECEKDKLEAGKIGSWEAEKLGSWEAKR
jgi:hypothetical protein